MRKKRRDQIRLRRLEFRRPGNLKGKSCHYILGGFDLVFSTLTLRHWCDQRKGVTEVRRVLAPGGRWLLADFVFMQRSRFVTRLLRRKHPEEREWLDGMLSDLGLAELGAERGRPGVPARRIRPLLTIIE
jgi:SAM-dependent methyltransferase